MTLEELLEKRAEEIAAWFVSDAHIAPELQEAGRLRAEYRAAARAGMLSEKQRERLIGANELASAQLLEEAKQLLAYRDRKFGAGPVS